MDDGFWGHPKVVDLMVSEGDGLRALGLWVMALSWAGQHTVDKPPDQQGVLPRQMILSWDRSWGNAASAAELLADVKLWDRLPDGAYRIHDFREWARLEAREKAQADGRKGAAKRWAQDPLDGVPIVDPSRGTNGHPNAGARRDPSRGSGSPPIRGGTGDPNDLLASPSPASPSPKNLNPLAQAELERAFDEFYWAFPRHVGKDAARRAYAKAVKRATVAEILAGARTFTAAVERRQTPPSKVPHPASWLNAGRWQDDDPDDAPTVREVGTFE